MNIITENYELYNGDCLEVMDRLIEQNVIVDMILCDPPYGNNSTSCKWDNIIPFDEMWSRLNKLIKPNGAIVLFGNEPFSSMLRCSNIKNYKYDWVWDKVKASGFQIAKYRPMIRTEYILVFCKNKLTYYPQLEEISKEEYEEKIKKLSKKNNKGIALNDMSLKPYNGRKKEELEKYKYKQPTNIIEVNRIGKECNSRNKVHPSQKPVDLLKYLIKTYTLEGELVLDFTMGSGSTGVACINTNRKFIGIELEENYFEIAINRIFENYNNNIN